MDIQHDLIWGDDDGSEVFARAHSGQLCLIFRFLLLARHPQSLPSRIVACFHDWPTKDASETFSDRASMRDAIHSSIGQVWSQCIAHPSIVAPDVIIEIYEDIEQQTQWRVSHESTYNQYVDSLLPMDRLFEGEEPKPQVNYFVDYSSLIQVNHFGGRGNVTVVRISPSSDSLYVFKGVDFGTFLESPANFRHRKDMCYHEIRMISSLPIHPNIVRPASIFVTVKKVQGKGRISVCGTLSPFMSHGTLDDQITSSNTAGPRLSLKNKGLWCFQMASALAHTHFTAHTFHMDIKPSNFVLDTHKDLILIDWEQSGAPLYTLAPEADGTWDIEEARIESPSCKNAASTVLEPVYRKYCGPYRENLAWGRPKWNVFPIWRNVSPRALESAEVFSLGRTMWMLLQQVAQSEVEDLEDVNIFWDEKSADIPESWKAVVGRCLCPDPNSRIRLSALVMFWEKQKQVI